MSRNKMVNTFVEYDNLVSLNHTWTNNLLSLNPRNKKISFTSKIKHMRYLKINKFGSNFKEKNILKIWNQLL